MNQKIEQRIIDLLVDRATGSLDCENAMELGSLLEKYPKYNDEGMELAAAAIELTMLEQESEMPAGLRDRLKQDATTHFAADHSDNAVVVAMPKKSEGRSPLPVLSGWIAAAAVLVLALWLRPQTPEITTPTLEERWQQVLQTADHSRAPLEATEDAAANGASGEIIWSADRQEGFMRLRGLAANDAGQEQYQLWVFDKDRDERYPIDGGVFNIPAGATEVIVPLDAKLAVQAPQLYAITVERPGGVVVSSRERIVLLGKPAG